MTRFTVFIRILTIPILFSIVGATGGNANSSPPQESNIEAPVAKITTLSLDIEWSTQIGAIPAPDVAFSSASALGCDVVRGAGYIYIAGNVEKGAVIVNEDDPQQSFGNDDIFYVGYPKRGHCAA
jgi:hypothetical protein